MITNQDLKDRNIYADDTTLALLGYAQLETEELDILNDVLGLPDGRTLTVRIGGIGYRAYKQNKYGMFVEATLNVPADALNLPLTVQVMVSHEPEGYADHLDFCPYGCDEWPKDEEGNSYWAYEGDVDYDEDTDTWSAPEDKRHYEPECNCPYVEDSVRDFTINEPEELAAVGQYISDLFAGVIAEA